MKSTCKIIIITIIITIIIIIIIVMIHSLCYMNLLMISNFKK